MPSRLWRTRQVCRLKARWLLQLHPGTRYSIRESPVRSLWRRTADPRTIVSGGNVFLLLRCVCCDDSHYNDNNDNDNDNENDEDAAADCTFGQSIHPIKISV